MTPPRSDIQSSPRVLWFYGADAVGKSTIGWEAYSILSDQHAHVAYVDTDYLSFCHPAPDNLTEVVADNLRGVWAVYRSRGADHMVVSGIVFTPADRDALTAAVPEAHFTFCRLTAAPATVHQRIMERREAEAATQGGVLSAETRAELIEYGRRSVEFSALLERFALEDFALATDEATPHELAGEAVRYLGADSRTPSTTSRTSR